MKVKGVADDATGVTTNVTQDVAQAKISTGRPWADAPIKVLVSVCVCIYKFHIGY